MHSRTATLSIALVGILLFSGASALTASANFAYQGGPAKGAVVPATADVSGNPFDPSHDSAVSSFPAVSIHPLISAYTFILPDGSLAGAPAPDISVSGYTYTLTASMSGAIVDERNGSVFDGSGYTLTTTSALIFGFQVNTTSNVTVDDLKIAGEVIGVQIINSTNVQVEYSSAAPATDIAFQVVASNDVTFLEDTADGSAVGFAAVQSSEISFSEDTANGGTLGFDLNQVFNAYLEDATATGGSFGVQAVNINGLDLYSGKFSSSTDVGLEIDSSEQVRADYILATGCGMGLSIGDVSIGDIDYSNFSKATSDGGQIEATSSFDLYNDTFWADGASGLAFNGGNQDELTDVAANASAVTGILLSNLTDSDVSYSFASSNGWNGLSIVNSLSVETFGDAFGSSISGNGTYLRSTSDVTLDNDTDSGNPDTGVYDYDSQGLSVVDSTVSADATAITFVADENIYAAYDLATDNSGSGFVLIDSADFELLNDLSYANGGEGFDAVSSIGGEILNCEANDSVGVGALLDGDTGTFLDNDTFDNVQGGLLLLSDSSTSVFGVFINDTPTEGVFLESTTDVILEDSNISDSSIGFLLVDSTQVNISGNTFFDNTDDFDIDAADLAVTNVYWNDFVDGGGWVFNGIGGNPNSLVFDAGYPGGGNYWSNFTSPDVEHGPNQNISGSDGIVDKPFNISGIFVDHYPLAHRLNFATLTVAFTEVGLPSNAEWGVQFEYGPDNFARYNTSVRYGPLDFNLYAAAWATYNYLVYSPSGWTAAPSTGSIVWDGDFANVTIDFSAVTYSTIFSQTGLTAGTSWNVTVNGNVYSGTGSAITVALANGTYNYSVPAIAGYIVTPASGSVTVSSDGSTISLNFARVLNAVSFTETGLSSGTTWSVTLAGVPESSTSTSITFHVANGSYAFTVGSVSGYSLAPASGTQLVTGPGSSVTVVYTANSNSLANAPGGVILFWALLAAVIVLAALVALLLMRGRKKPETGAPATWTPPPGTAAPAPPPPGPAGVPPPGAVGPPPPANWIEG